MHALGALAWTWIQASSELAWAGVYRPLETIYLQGPLLGGYGFWGGMAPGTVCATITGTEARFWDNDINRFECNDLISKRVTGFVLLCLMVGALGFVYTAVSALYTRFVYVNPVVAEIRALRQSADAAYFPTSSIPLGNAVACCKNDTPAASLALQDEPHIESNRSLRYETRSRRRDKSGRAK